MLNTIIDWVASHILEAVISSAFIIILGLITVRIFKSKNNIKGNNNNIQQAGGDIKNIKIKGSENKVSIK